MLNPSQPIAVYLEVGKKRIIAGAIDWPGWCRVGRDEADALKALIDCAPRYAIVLQSSALDFSPPQDVSAFTVVERVEGNTTTDFGAPDVAPAGDNAPVDDVELQRLKRIMQACWAALDATATAASGKELSKGPRGGGRDLAVIIGHVTGAEASYLSRLGGKLPKGASDNDYISDYIAGSRQVAEQRREVILDALGAATRGEFPAQGPRGGARWSPRFFVRRAAWHILDHVWEIEDRVI